MKHYYIIVLSNREQSYEFTLWAYSQRGAIYFAFVALLRKVGGTPGAYGKYHVTEIRGG